MEEHPPAYPGGPCLGCGEPWPCIPRRAAMLKEFAKAPNEAVTYMGAWVQAGVLELNSRGCPVEPGRHLGWIGLLLEAQEIMANQDTPDD
ncbi:hypothetical protein [Micromonospora sp. RTGN7]|uniref:hypothetical protein n=1 Tax=Micromonospora sp. RTGN7 TaxID=3016526 RepID=UPI0029FED908|nr:hypothetical protein [Micromonospora sp. RTGN7]